MSSIASPADTRAAWRVLWLSTISFTLLFNVWLMLGVLAIPIRAAFALTDSQVEWLVATAILSGACLRLSFGIWAERFGGRNTMMFLMVAAAVPTYLFSQATTYPQLLICAGLFGIAGNSFAAGIAWNSAWFPARIKGTALGVFGAGNVGAVGTKLLVLFVPSVLTIVPAAGYFKGWLPGGWRAIPACYAALLLVMASVTYWLAPTPDPIPAQGRPMSELLAPLKEIRVWRFSLYYVVVFGAYVALSGWLPKYYVDTYGLSLHTAALYTATFIVPASLLRPLGGYLSDKLGPRGVTYTVFCVMTVALSLLSVPPGIYAGMTYRPSAEVLGCLLFVVGCAMGIGKASVFKYIPNYFPRDVGAVGGLVGMLGALGGFVLPPLFGILARTSGRPQLAFLALLALTASSLLWLQLTLLRMTAVSHAAPKLVTPPLAQRSA